MKKQVLLAALCIAGAAGLAQAGTQTADMVVPSNTATFQAGHLMKVARVLLGYDAAGNPIYGHEHLRRQIIGYDRFGHPIWGHLYHNRPLFTSPDVVATIARPYNPHWDWRGHHWDRDWHRNAFHGRHDWDRHDHD